MAPKSNEKNYDECMTTLNVMVGSNAPRRRVQRHYPWQSHFPRRSYDEDVENPNVPLNSSISSGISSGSQLKPSSRVGKKKRSYRNIHGLVGLTSKLANASDTRIQRILMLFFSFYIISFLWLTTAPSAFHANNSNVVLGFLRQSVCGRNWISSLANCKVEEDLNALLEKYEAEDTDDDYFSACIMYMDDNHRLEEWLAYHYFLLKLRYVVINVDPRSTSNPQAIVDRWTGKNKIYDPQGQNSSLLDYNLNMTIVLWNDTYYIDPIQYEFEQAKIYHASGNEKFKKATAYHKHRQPLFYQACTRHLIYEREKQEKQYQMSDKQYDSGNTNSTLSNDTEFNTTFNGTISGKKTSQWTMYIDTDEFLAFETESYGEVESTTSPHWHKYETPGHVLRRLNALKREGIRTEKIRREHNLKGFLAELAQNGTDATRTLHYGSTEINVTGATKMEDVTIPPRSSLSCLVIPRYDFCSIELSQNETKKLLNSSIELSQNETKKLLNSSSSNETTTIPSEFVPSEFVMEKLLLEPSNGKGENKRNGTSVVRSFDTLRYKYRSPGLSNRGKSVLDLSETNIKEYAKGNEPWRTHQPIHRICVVEKYAKYGQRTLKMDKLLQNQMLVRIIFTNYGFGSWHILAGIRNFLFLTLSLLLFLIDRYVTAN